MNIPPNDFRWCAAFHDEGEHPHIHMMAWSAGDAPGYLSKTGIKQIKSDLTNDFFRQEMLHVYEQKSQSRDELVAEARHTMLKLADEMKQGVCEHPEVEQLMLTLSRDLKNVKGKKQYGYLSKPLKKQVDEIVAQMARLPSVQESYEKWLELQQQVNEFYSGKPYGAGTALTAKGIPSYSQRSRSSGAPPDGTHLPGCWWRTTKSARPTPTCFPPR